MSHTNPTVDTIEALHAAHTLLKKSLMMSKVNPVESTRLNNVANAGFSAVVPYLRTRIAAVQREHYKSIAAMMKEAKRQ